MQTKKQSLIESITNVLIGYIVAVISNAAILPLFGVNLAFSDNLLIGVWFTVISVIRGYCVRRWFNKRGMNEK